MTNAKMTQTKNKKKTDQEYEQRFPCQSSENCLIEWILGHVHNFDDYRALDRRAAMGQI